MLINTGKTSTNRSFLDNWNFLLRFYWIFGYMDIHLTNVNQQVQMYTRDKLCTSAFMPDFNYTVNTFCSVLVQMAYVF